MSASLIPGLGQGSGNALRRDVLKSAACGFGYLALAGLMGEQARAAAAAPAGIGKPGYPLAPKAPHFAARAKRVIFLYMQGGPSHVDTFDYKPALAKLDGKGATDGNLLASPFKFNRSGKSGLPISEIYPNLSQHADDLCLINSMHTPNPAHPQATIFMHTGSVNFVRPSLGAWTLYGLGTENQDLPGFIAINPLQRLGGAQNYGSSFLPATFQGTGLGGENKDAAVANIVNSQWTPAEQRNQLDFMQSLNRDFLGRSGPQPELEGVIESYELAFRMQKAVPGVMDFSKESKATLEAYGVGQGRVDGFAKQCLLARRFAEAGVRFIELHHGGWDQHNQLEARLRANAGATDQPIAALLADLKQRDMLKDTLVVWTGEFGRTPAGQGRDGRKHNNRGFTTWLAGAGVKGGFRYGATDETGDRAVQDKVDVHDLHATILHMLGLHHEKLTYRYGGRDFRLTDVYGKVATGVLA